VLVSHRWNKGTLPLASSQLTFDDVIQPKAGELAAPLTDATLLIPLYVGNDQIGVLILGQPENALRYSQNDIEMLLERSDSISGLLQLIRRETENLSHVSELARLRRSAPQTASENFPIQLVEEALRNLHDHSYLGNSPLAELAQVKRQLSPSAMTHLDRGKEVHRILCSGLEKLRPAGDLPHEPIPREWYAYVILHDAYVNGVQNRDIMSHLYISEGTFSRTRRTAIRSLAKALAEMENS
jgi:hypothetical protein